MSVCQKDVSESLRKLNIAQVLLHLTVNIGTMNKLGDFEEMFSI